LHQASFHWKNVLLRHHYRSEHPELIRFSNRNFYKNELIAFPSAQATEAPIRLHYCSAGVFDERQNQVEAQEVAKLLEAAVFEEEHVGVVAFSETQLSAIISSLSRQCSLALEQRIMEGTAFCKALENVQGEECDRLIISLGYGRNVGGEFHMRFGPLNTRNGSKRLNVLLTRAKRGIDFFSSVQSSDFKISDNEAVDLLRRFLAHIEVGLLPEASFDFPMNLSPYVKQNTLSFNQIYQKISDAHELVTLTRVLENRGWKVRFTD
jgi:superfamily I DNA and/or RNA helicase